MNFKELNILQKFCDNRVDLNMFLEATQYSATYGEVQFNDFRRNPISYITSRAEERLFKYIQIEIETAGYKG